MDLLHNRKHSFLNFFDCIITKCPCKLFQCIFFFCRKGKIFSSLKFFEIFFWNIQWARLLNPRIMKCRKNCSSHSTFFYQMSDSKLSHLIVNFSGMFCDIELNSTFFQTCCKHFECICRCNIQAVDC